MQKKKLRVNVGKNKVKRSSRYGNGGRLHGILNGKPLEEVDCLCVWGHKWQLMDDGKGMWYTE